MSHIDTIDYDREAFASTRFLEDLEESHREFLGTDEIPVAGYAVGIAEMADDQVVATPPHYPAL